MQLIIISGRSGSGKSSALHVLEDSGFTCVDNLPASLLPGFITQTKSHKTAQKVAVSIDARNVWQDFDLFPSIIASAQLEGLDCTVIFLDARDDVLIQRFSETRRKHPLSNQDTDLKEAVNKERELLAPIMNVADLVVDSSELSLHELRDVIKKRISTDSSSGMAILFQSFGFKHGVPIDADMVFDVRCLPNPYWKPNLRPYSGLDQPVKDYLGQESDVQDMINDIMTYLDAWLPRFEASNRSYFTVAVGCTGGQHRSVFVSESLYERCSKHFKNTLVRHRELSRKK